MRLSTADTTSVLGRDLAGLACDSPRGASGGTRRGSCGRARAVPRGSRYASLPRRHMAWLAALERGDPSAEAGSDSHGVADSTYESRREILMAVAATRLEHGQWQVAHHTLRRDRPRLDRNRDALRGALEPDATDSLWSQWRVERDGPTRSCSTRCARAAPGRRAGARLRESRRSPESNPPTLLARPRRCARVGLWPPPRRRNGAACRPAARARHRSGRRRGAPRRSETAAARARPRDLRRYLGQGLERQRREHAAVETTRRPLRLALAELLASTRASRRCADETKRRVAARFGPAAGLAEIRRAGCSRSPLP
jgi:hypothetical protein